MSGYSERFANALLFATELHAEQTRKGSGVPYITHLIGVAALVGDHGGSESQVIGALLHDAIEDCIETRPDLPEEIASRYGEDVLAMVQAVSDTEVHPKPPWEERKRAYIAHVEEAADDDPSLLISVADKLYNARTILRDLGVVGDEIWDRFKASKAQSLWYYRSLADAFLAKKWPTETQAQLAVALDKVVAQLEAS
ncbi:MAG: HD domain-containing protein [Myxococcota bacterium]|jgi:GTP pyrophosphokinase|nr:HD domain-containing protein [Myxococcota bacterium]MEC9442242.1 HD domain-containing protein [Myxococcota bacterium]